MFALITLPLIHYAARLSLAAGGLGYESNYYSNAQKPQQLNGYHYNKPSTPFEFSGSRTPKPPDDFSFFSYVPNSRTPKPPKDRLPSYFTSNSRISRPPENVLPFNLAFNSRTTKPPQIVLPFNFAFNSRTTKPPQNVLPFNFAFNSRITKPTQNILPFNFAPNSRNTKPPQDVLPFNFVPNSRTPKPPQNIFNFTPNSRTTKPPKDILPFNFVPNSRTPKPPQDIFNFTPNSRTTKPPKDVLPFNFASNSRTPKPPEDPFNFAPNSKTPKPPEDPFNFAFDSRTPKTPKDVSPGNFAPDSRTPEPRKDLLPFYFDPNSITTEASVMSSGVLPAIDEAESTFGKRISEQMCRAEYLSNPRGAQSDVDQFTHMAAIGWKISNGGYNYRCGGSLISSFFVLTAGHCRNIKGKIPDVVRIGGGSLNSTQPEQQPIQIINVYVHPVYSRKQIYNDIALLKLKSKSSYKPACLWPVKSINYRAATVIGYGRTASDITGSNNLIKADVNLILNEECASYYPPAFRNKDGIISTQLCSLDLRKSKETCPGDSGGPILVNRKIQGITIPYILGITSFGEECAQGIPVVYTKVSSFLDWIEPIVWKGQ